MYAHLSACGRSAPPPRPPPPGQPAQDCDSGRELLGLSPTLTLEGQPGGTRTPPSLYKRLLPACLAPCAGLESLTAEPSCPGGSLCLLACRPRGPSSSSRRSHFTRRCLRGGRSVRFQGARSARRFGAFPLSGEFPPTAVFKHELRFASSRALLACCSSAAGLPPPLPAPRRVATRTSSPSISSSCLPTLRQIFRGPGHPATYSPFPESFPSRIRAVSTGSLCPFPSSGFEFLIQEDFPKFLQMPLGASLANSFSFPVPSLGRLDFPWSHSPPCSVRTTS